MLNTALTLVALRMLMLGESSKFFEPICDFFCRLLNSSLSLSSSRFLLQSIKHLSNC